MHTATALKVRIEGGMFTPFYSNAKEPKAVRVLAFSLDARPVTNGEYLGFIHEWPTWNATNIKRMFADSGYLKQFNVGANIQRIKKAPVVNVSWFAADAFCRARGGRLPSVLEWEYVAAASEDQKDASHDPAFVQKLLGWYSAPNAPGDQVEVGKGRANAWGVYDMHGLVWEWTDDFNSVFVSGDNRRDGDSLKNVFCGAGSFSAEDKANYAAFMRYAFRSSLKGNYTTENLGFRCAYDIR